MTKPEQTVSVPRRWVGLPLALFGVVAVLFAAGCVVGSRVGPPEIALLLSLRGPRTTAVLVSGLAIGMAAFLLRGHLHNPVADPGLLGLAAGSAVCQVAVLAALGPAAVVFPVLLGCGASGAALVLSLLSATARSRPGHLAPVLVGVGVTVCFGALAGGMALVDPVTAAGTMHLWAVGSSAQVTEWPVTAAVAVGGLLCGTVWWVPAFDLLDLGEEIAASAGVPVRAAHVLRGSLVSVAVAVSTALTGPVLCIGVVATWAVTRSAPGRGGLAAAALAVAAALLASDLLGRVLARPAEVPLGAIASAVGCLCLVALVRSRRLVRP